MTNYKGILIRELKKIKQKIGEVCEKIFKLKKENLTVFNSLKFKTKSNIYKRIVIDEKSIVSDVLKEISQLEKGRNPLSQNNSNLLGVSKKNHLCSSTSFKNIGSRYRLMPSVRKLDNKENDKIFEFLKSNLEKHITNEKRIQKNLEIQIKRMSLSNEECSSLIINSFKEFLLFKNYDVVRNEEFLDLLDFADIGFAVIKEFVGWLFKNEKFKEYIRLNYRDEKINNDQLEVI